MSRLSNYLILASLLLAGALLLSAEPHHFHGNYFYVELVIDGDTIFLSNGESVRYIGVDAPETRHPSRGLECFGPEATERNRELIEGRWVELEEDVIDRDKYGRLLRYVYVDGEMVNATLIKEGYAYSYYYPPNIKYYRDLLDLEIKAEQSGSGLWSSCR